MNEQHLALVKKFYSSFAHHDAKGMAECYHDEVEFTDPAFGKLQGQEVNLMWQMLVEKGGDELVVIYSNLQADGQHGSAYWEAIYNFSKRQRKVHNQVVAHFEFQDGLIKKHTDTFDFWRWARMALGPMGLALGWSHFFRGKFQKQARKILKKYARGHTEAHNPGAS